MSGRIGVAEPPAPRESLNGSPAAPAPHAGAALPSRRGPEQRTIRARQSTPAFL